VARERPEQIIHRTIVAHLRARAVPGCTWWHTPNGGWRSPVEAAIFKSLGVRAGVADLLLLHDGQFFALELKAPAGGSVKVRPLSLMTSRPPAELLHEPKDWMRLCANSNGGAFCAVG
jgi:hypothetical protein